MFDPGEDNPGHHEDRRVVIREQASWGGDCDGGHFWEDGVRYTMRKYGKLRWGPFFSTFESFTYTLEQQVTPPTETAATYQDVAEL